MLASPQLQNRIIDPTSPLMSNRMTKMGPAAPTSTIPQSPYVQNRSVNPEQASTAAGSRDIRGNAILRENSSASGQNRLGTYANVKPNTILPQGATVPNTMMPQSPAMRLFRAPRNSQPQPQPAKATSSNMPPQRLVLQRFGDEVPGFAREDSQPQSTPVMRARSPLRLGAGPLGISQSQAPTQRTAPSGTPYQLSREASGIPHTWDALRSPGTPQSILSRGYRVPPTHTTTSDRTAAAIAAGLGHATPRGTIV